MNNVEKAIIEYQLYFEDNSYIPKVDTVHYRYITKEEVKYENDSDMEYDYSLGLKWFKPCSKEDKTSIECWHLS